jgi:hypothetical protein
MGAVSPTTRAVIWARAAGRCQYPSCNASLIGDLISGTEDANFGFVAHIVADKPTGPRGDPVRSGLLRDDPVNLMLLCYPHHKLIDVDDVPGHPEQRLLDMKAAHEDRIRIVGEISPDQASHVLRYGARIGEHDSTVSFDRVRVAMLPVRFPAEGRSIGVQIQGAAGTDREDAFWPAEVENLRRQYDRQVRSRIADGDIKHLSVFALAPIPLLIELGHLLGDITPAEVYQLHREPAGWTWARDRAPLEFRVIPPAKGGSATALVLSISATITPQRISAVLGEDVAVWEITVDTPHNDVIRSPADLQGFRSTLRAAFNNIKEVQGGSATIHVFPAVPVSIAVEIGRVWMPKADLALALYDETRDRGFVRRLEIR